MPIVQKILAFALTIGLLVTIHELGHFVVARWSGVKVLRFSIGFGRVVWSRRCGRDQTEWAISAIPLGGYVKMLDEREGEVSPRELDRAFNRQSVWKRILIVLAGPVANLLLAALLFTAMYLHGVPGQRALLAATAAGTPAAVAGLRGGDVVTAVNGDAVKSWQDLRWRLLKATGSDEASVTVDDERESRTVALSLRALSRSDWEGNLLGALGLHTDLGPPLVQEIVPDRPAARVGLRAGDRLVAIDGERMRSPSDVATLINANPARRLHLQVQRDKVEIDFELTPDRQEQDGRSIGVAGVRLSVDPAVAETLAITVRYGLVDAFVQGTRRTWELSVFTLKMLGRIVTGDASLKNISGPFTMADYAGQSAQQGLLTFAGYLALISISLGVLNLLPVPLLDGGHLMYYLAEIFKGSPLSDRAFEVGQRIGMAVLALLMALALFNDVSRLF